MKEGIPIGNTISILTTISKEPDKPESNVLHFLAVLSSCAKAVVIDVKWIWRFPFIPVFMDTLVNCICAIFRTDVFITQGGRTAALLVEWRVSQRKIHYYIVSIFYSYKWKHEQYLGGGDRHIIILTMQHITFLLKSVTCSKSWQRDGPDSSLFSSIKTRLDACSPVSEEMIDIYVNDVSALQTIRSSKSNAPLLHFSSWSK